LVNSPICWSKCQGKLSAASLYCRLMSPFGLWKRFIVPHSISQVPNLSFNSKSRVATEELIDLMLQFSKLYRPDLVRSNCVHFLNNGIQLICPFHSKCCAIEFSLA
jgi:hypothetical protein